MLPAGHLGFRVSLCGRQIASLALRSFSLHLAALCGSPPERHRAPAKRRAGSGQVQVVGVDLRPKMMYQSTHSMREQHHGDAGTVIRFRASCRGNYASVSPQPDRNHGRTPPNREATTAGRR
jgi:hypothetical protein